MKKGNKGFTLIELVVVIAIVGVLAAILIPTMLNYVNKSKQQSCNADARSIFNDLAAYASELNFKGDTSELPDGIYTFNCTLPGTVVNSTLNNRISKGANGTLQDNSVVLVKFDNGRFPRVVVARNVNDKYFGAFPDPVKGTEGTFAEKAVTYVTSY